MATLSRLEEANRILEQRRAELQARRQAAAAAGETGGLLRAKESGSGESQPHNLPDPKSTFCAQNPERVPPCGLVGKVDGLGEPSQGSSTSWELTNGQLELERRRRYDGVTHTPPADQAQAHAQIWLGGFCKGLATRARADLPAETGAKPTSPAHVKHYPALGLAALDQEEARLYRAWLLFRFLDEAGRGWLSVTEVRAALTEEGSPSYLCTWRNLRDILNEGEGAYWTTERSSAGWFTGRIWLRSAAKAAAYLRVERLEGRPVALEMDTLTGEIGDVRAHLWASQHSGRRRPAPVARSTERELTGIPERTQRHYCERAGVERRQNIAVGEQHDQATHQERAWHHGNGTFVFTDYQGKQGRQGQRYVAWHLPSTHFGPHQQLPKGRQRKINQALADLVNNGAQGNGGRDVDRLFHADGKEAGKAYNRQGGEFDAYWPQKTGTRPFTLWHVLPSQEAGNFAL